MMKTIQSGFTLIELVVVITILGILSAFALPKFIGLESSARAAVVGGLEGSIKASASMAHALQLAGGSGPNDSITLADGSGTVVAMSNGYPTNSTEIEKLIEDSSDFDCTSGTDCQLSSAITPGSCAVTYTGSASVGAFPTVGTVISGC